jgi:hypothetical protein
LQLCNIQLCISLNQVRWVMQTFSFGNRSLGHWWVCIWSWCYVDHPVVDDRCVMLKLKLMSWLQTYHLNSYNQLQLLWADKHSVCLKMMGQDILSRNTNKMQLCNRIYYSKVYWRLSMFRAAHRSSSGALNCICRLWFIHPRGDRLLPRLSGKKMHFFFPLSLGNGRSPRGCINQRRQIQFRAPDDEWCAARNMLSLQ